MRGSTRKSCNWTSGIADRQLSGNRVNQELRRQLSASVADNFNRRLILDKREVQAKTTTESLCASIFQVRLELPSATSFYQVCDCQGVARESLCAKDTT